MTTAKQTRAEESAAPPASGLRPSARATAEKIYREALPFVLVMARNKGLDEADQWDVAQSVAVVIVEKIDEYRPGLGSAQMWGAGIARRILLDTRRTARTARRRFEPAESLSALPSFGLTPEEAERARVALAFVDAGVREECREPFLLNAMGMPAREIAGVLDLPMTTVQDRIRRARSDIERVLLRMGEDKESAPRVRGALLPFVSASDVERALRVPKLRDGLADELWREVLERLGEAEGDDGSPAHAPPARPDGPRAARPPVKTGSFERGRVALARGQLFGGGFCVFIAGVAVGLALQSAPADPPAKPPSITADTSRAAVVTAAAPARISTSTAATALARLPSTETERAPAAATAANSATLPEASSIGRMAAESGAATSANPATMPEDMLLRYVQSAISRSPALALSLLQIHARRFPSHSGARDALTMRALMALGRRSEAEAYARAMRGTIYEKTNDLVPAGPTP